MKQFRIRLNNTNSVNSVNTNNKLSVSVQQTTKPFVYTSLKDEVDQYEVFLNEKNNCNQFRLITTLNPYCTNILFNPITEIVKLIEYDDGSHKWQIRNDIKEDVDLTKDNEKVKVYGIEKPTRVNMIQNTEYSREDIGYEYYPGYDIFNNHILRNKTFKVVNPYSGTDVPVYKENNETVFSNVFNTLYDYNRNYNGDNIKLINRKSITEIDNNDSMHLYIKDDIMDISECVNVNLIEENGWVGFVNKSSIITKQNDGVENKRKKWVDEDFNLIINNKDACEFIDRYPDRTLYSFNPKYNEALNRVDYNWDYILTYPYENFYNHKLIKDNDGNKKLNALLISKVELMIDGIGNEILMFHTLTKHNLKAGDKINLYWKNIDNYNVFNELIIKNIGDIDLNDKEYCFYTTNIDVLSDIETIQKDVEKLYDSTEKSKIRTDINEELEKITFRFKHLINGYESEYYIRKFRELDNLNKEEYPLAFSSTIYGDRKTQITFTDNIDIENITDNRGRPLTEIYLTIIKNNEGNKEWYTEGVENGEIAADIVEYSHCFSDVSCGFDLKWFNENINDGCSDVKRSYDGNNNFKNSWCNIKKFDIDEQEETFDEKIVLDVSKNNEYFIGDIVEFNITTYNEIILEDTQFRFNTYLREHALTLSNFYKFHYDELSSDDYDQDGFKITVPDKNGVVQQHPEGYFYKAHYPIQLKEFDSEIHQASHYDLKIKKVYLDSVGDKVFLFVQTTLPHKLQENDLLLICDDERDRILRTNVTYVKNHLIFAISDVGQFTCTDMYKVLSGKISKLSFNLRRYNSEIPSYAEKIPYRNAYLWRNVNTVGNKNNTKLPEYTFNNGCFYINQEINFFLKRQDPFGDIGLYYDGSEGGYVPNDIYGNPLPASNFEYKDESQVTC